MGVDVILDFYIHTIYTEMMTGRVVPLARSTGGSRSTAEDRVTVVCARPRCRREFQRSLTRGRRQDYCSPQCRREVDAERRRSRALLKHYEGSVAKLRADQHAYGAGESTVSATAVSAEDALRTQLARVEGLLVFADSNDPAVAYLVDLAAAATRYLDASSGHRG